MKLEDIQKLQENFINSYSTYSYIDYLNYNEYVSRGTGRTHYMIQKLPTNEKIILLTVNRYIIDYIKNMIAEKRPEIDIKNIRFVSTANPNWENTIKGYRGAVYVDHAVLDEMNRRNNINFLNELNRRHNV